MSIVLLFAGMWFLLYLAGAYNDLIDHYKKVKQHQKKWKDEE